MMIVPVTDENFEQAAHIYGETWRESHRNVCSPAFLQSRDCAAYLRKGRTAGKRLFLLLDPKPVGLVSILDREIGDLYILPEWQGRGYGSRLLEYALERVEKPYLTVLSSNLRAIQLYGKYGFFPTARKQLREGLWELTLERHYD